VFFSFTFLHIPTLYVVVRVAVAAVAAFVIVVIVVVAVVDNREGYIIITTAAAAAAKECVGCVEFVEGVVGFFLRSEKRRNEVYIYIYIYISLRL